MKRFSGMIRAFALAIVMVCVLCVNSLAVCTQVRVNQTINRQYYATYRTGYVTICNVSDSGSCKLNTFGSRNISIANNYGRIDNDNKNVVILEANKSVTYKVDKGGYIKINLNCMNGGGNPYVVISGGVY